MSEVDYKEKHQKYKAKYYHLKKELAEGLVEQGEQDGGAFVEESRGFKNDDVEGKTYPPCFRICGASRAMHDDLKELGDLGLLFTGLAGKLVESLVDTYLNPEGLSMLIEKSEKKDEIPKPTIITLLGGFTIMDFNGHSSFYITYENEGEEFPIFFNRKGLTWKITQIEFPEDLLSSLK